jgi:protein-tyrosine-phosphatase
MVRQADFILVMEPFHRDIVVRALPEGAKHRVRLLAAFENPPRSDTIDDPYNKPFQTYQACLERIHRCLDGFIAHLAAERWDGANGPS